MEQQTNPLLDFSGLPRFGAIEPVHVTPAVDALLQQARDVVRQVTDPKTPGFVGRHRRAARRRHRPPRPGLGRGVAPERGGRHAGTARAVQRQPAEADGVLHRAVPERGAVRALQGTGRAAGLRVLARGAAQGDRERAEGLPPRRRRTAGRPQAALQGARRARGAGVDALRGERARRDQRVRAVRRRREGARGRAGRRGPDVRGGGGRRRPRRLQGLAAVPELRGDRRLRRRPGVAPAALSRVRDQGVGIRQAGVEQRTPDGRAAVAAAGARAAARVRELRRGVAGAEDGRPAVGSARLPARPRAPRPAVRRARRARSARVRGRRRSASPTCSRGTSRTRARSCARRATPTRSRS